MDLLDLTLKVLGAVVGVVALIGVLHVTGMIDLHKLKGVLLEKGIKRAVIAAINRSKNVISIKDLDSSKTLKIRGDDVSRDLNEGDRIYV